MRRLILFSMVFFLVSIITLILTVEHYDKLDVKCRGEFESHVNDNKISANVGVSFSGGKGVVIISGIFYGGGDEIRNMKVTTVFNYSLYGKLMYLTVSQQHSSISDTEFNEKLQYLLPMVFSSRDIEYVYEFQLQSGGDYLIKQHGIPILYCKKT
ncbi:hypothetical protein N6A11_003188 [Klebsiella oxytoca]|uniref:hypothetical protein n=1 Tax=Klebsiella oxytoca TaxID=571 RepID=UPI001F181C76|nr:hypothetical protein [Klebsiella oxytoca]EJV1071183.1 hypothetical protein [Klebsiella oxytoca]MCE5397556.1 hypothetical protein [Klebsiella oxytoca]